MKRFKNILCLFDEGSRGIAALERATTLAMENQARLTIVEAIGELPTPREMRQLVSLWRPLLVEDPHELIVKQRQKQLAQLIEPVRRRGVEGDTLVLAGDPFLEVTREVIRNGHDLVIMSAGGGGGFREWLFGTTAMHLMRKCACPVWVIKPAQTEHYARILAAVDTDPDDSSREPLNSTIMELATSLARLEQSELHVVHAWRMYDESMLRYSGDATEDQMANWLRETQESHQQALDRLLGKYDLTNLEHRIHLEKGEAAAVIPKLAHKEQVELIVMGTVCRTGIAGFFIGNTAENILQEVDCSVLTVKPEGFVSPVKA